MGKRKIFIKGKIGGGVRKRAKCGTCQSLLSCPLYYSPHEDWEACIAYYKHIK